MEQRAKAVSQKWLELCHHCVMNSSRHSASIAKAESGMKRVVRCKLQVESRWLFVVGGCPGDILVITMHNQEIIIQHTLHSQLYRLNPKNIIPQIILRSLHL